MTVPFDKVGAVIGQQGVTIKKVRRPTSGFVCLKKMHGDFIFLFSTKISWNITCVQFVIVLKDIGHYW